MAETLGSLCDKLTIVKLKAFHCDDLERLRSLEIQTKTLIEEIDHYLVDAFSGKFEISKLTFSANKIYKESGNETRDINGSLGEVFNKLAEINCALWHQQEKVYEFELVPLEEKDGVVKKLAILNLERNKCMDEINNYLVKAVKSNLSSKE